MKNNKGFTLIELMIAIAIIGILALVLIPRVAGVKDQAREAGLDTNIRIAASIAEGLLDRFSANATGCISLESALATKLDSNKIQNPFTKNDDIVSIAPVAGAASFAYADELAAAEASEFDFTTIGTDVDYAGVIGFDAYVSGGKLYVTFIPFGSDGAIVPGKEATTN